MKKSPSRRKKKSPRSSASRSSELRRSPEAAPLASAALATPIGRVRVLASSQGLVEVKLGGSDRVSEGADPAARRWAKEAVRQIREYFHGRRQVFDLPLVIEGTAFQKTVWRRLQKIPYGATCSYRDLAEKSGFPRAFRAAGSANGRNGLPLVIPCHRVIAADGSEGGYSGGLHRKKWLLRFEKSVANRS